MFLFIDYVKFKTIDDYQLMSQKIEKKRNEKLDKA